ncbi:MAG TPA: hypothetical protein VHJ77_02615 [Vicinamibacterales bacterium]|nr:hypothetical protein [Vicinamibacterales bacterium]
MTRFLTASVCAALLSIPQAALDPRREVHDYLTKNKFTAEELASFDAGDVVARATVLKSAEILVVSAVKILISRDRVLDFYGRVISYVDGTVTLAFGRFSTPPALDDVRDLTFDPGDVSDLRSCKPGKCDVKLGGAGIQTLQKSIDWSAPDAADRVNAFVRKAAVDYVAAYQSQGDAGLVTYNDRSQPVSLQQQWRDIIGGAAYFHQYEPALKAYLEQYPRGSLAGGRDVFYWVKENYGYKPVVSIVHGVVYQPPSRGDRAFAVQKQIYASHYFEGSLAMATLLSATENGAPATYLVYANRSRGDVLRGSFGGLRRNVAQSQARQAAEETLGSIKRQLEQ